MSALSEPIKFRCTVEQFHSERGGSVSLKLEVPAADAAEVARLVVMGDIVFAAVLTPDDVRKKTPLL